MNLDDTYYLPRASRYSNPLNGAARLPLPYGDLTDGSDGHWALPCIDTVNHVYAFAGCEVLSVANGNSVTIYNEGVEVSAGDYTFSHSNDYEGEGSIATVTFSSTQANSEISARGKGVDDGAGSLLENIIDIVEDFLTNKNDFSSSGFDATTKAAARAVFAAQGYQAAGVITKDINYWDLLQQMMGTFLGSVYNNALRLLVLEIDDGSVRHVAKEILRVADVLKVTSTQRLENLVNRCPCNYGYDYAAGDWRHNTDDSDDGDAASQSIHGERTPETAYPFYWCRHAASVATVQAIIIGRFAAPLWEIEIETDTMRYGHVDDGDVIAATVRDLYDINGDMYINQLLRVVGVRPDLGKCKMTFRTNDTGGYLTRAYPADGSYLADGSVRAGGDRDTTIY